MNTMPAGGHAILPGAEAICRGKSGATPTLPETLNRPALADLRVDEKADRQQEEETEGAEDEEDEDGGFPLEGKYESQIECLTCGFKPQPTASTFCTLTLNVPQASSTSLSTCFDGMFKTEYIDDFKCEKCGSCMPYRS